MKSKSCQQVTAAGDKQAGLNLIHLKKMKDEGRLADALRAVTSSQPLKASKSHSAIVGSRPCAARDSWVAAEESIAARAAKNQQWFFWF